MKLGILIMSQFIKIYGNMTVPPRWWKGVDSHNQTLDNDTHVLTMSIETMMITSGFYGYPIFGQSHMIKIGSRAAGSPRFVIVWRGHRTTKLIATYCYYLMGVSNASSKSFHVYFRTEQTIISGCGASGCILPALPFCLLLIFLKRNQSSYCFILVTYDNIHIIYIYIYIHMLYMNSALP